MTGGSVQHGTITLERTYDASPARVFAAWSRPGAQLEWALPDGCEGTTDRFDFRVGGSAAYRYGPAGGPMSRNEERYEDIVPDARIVSSIVETGAGGERHYVSLLTVELHRSGGGCRLVLTEQGVFLDGHDRPENHEAGWNGILDALGAELRRRATA